VCDINWPFIYKNFIFKEEKIMLPILLATADTAATLQLDFDPSQMFSYTNVITSSMMPLVYISAGFALGFTIIYALKNAFSGGVRL
jgi:hypothetical protein